MLKDNLVMLRRLNGYSQERVAQAIEISRQAYAKWESGATVPDVEKASRLAELYGVTVDALVRTESAEGVGVLPPAPKGKSIWGSVTLGERGQVVIPKAVRERFGFEPGERLVVLSDEMGVALVSAKVFEAKIQELRNMILE